MGRIVLLSAATLLATGCAGLRLDALLGEKSELRQERGQVVGIGVGEGSSDDLALACAIATQQAQVNGLQRLTDAGLRPTRRPVVREKLVDPAGRCRVKLAWSGLKRSGGTRTVSPRAQVRGLVVIPTQPGATAPVAAAPPAVDSSAPVPPPPPVLGQPGAPVPPPPPPVAVAPAAATAQVQPIIYVDLRSGAYAPAPVMQRQTTAVGAAPVATVSRPQEALSDEPEQRTFGIGAGLVLGPINEVGIEVPISIRLARPLRNKLAVDLNFAPSIYPDDPSFGSRVELAVAFQPIELFGFRPFAGAAVGSRFVLEDPTSSDGGLVGIAVEPTAFIGSSLFGTGLETRASLGLPIEFIGDVEFASTLSGSLLYRF